ncbi:carbohydrate transporter [Bifidobacterium margollesii]|uniref:D-ribose pyranase n=1 Tax=Bifidobacterium margollesii TaxID=2020964 RepID=A0A2N5J877_9BIFI|nr:D-ribose pyranase [Bifidobacterium margollesii]PLS30395.1 carbohydrate transporter [Bifidobacterium margollesii]
MQPNKILNAKLAGALATLGHTDVVLVTDAGFPIPKDANIVDLGLTAGTVDVLEILRVLRAHMFVEEVRFAPEVKTEYPALYKDVQEIYTGSGAEFIPAPHEELIAEWAPKAKVVIRSGSLTAWANFALVASTDPYAWFRDDEPVEPLPLYKERRRRIEANEVPDFKTV